MEPSNNSPEIVYGAEAIGRVLNEAKARAMLKALSEAGVTVRFSRKDGEWGVRFPDYPQLTPEQKKVAADLLLFGVAYPRCYATLVRLHRGEDEAPEILRGTAA